MIYLGSELSSDPLKRGESKIGLVLMLLLLLYVVWIILAFLYLFFWIDAYGHRTNKKDILGALSPYWCFCEEIYDDNGKKVCKKGKVIVLLFVILAVMTEWIKSN